MERERSGYRMPVLAVHAPLLLIIQRVWVADPVVRLDRAVQAATELGASTARVDALARADRMGAQLMHLHLADGTGASRDEHLLPGGHSTLRRSLFEPGEGELHRHRCGRGGHTRRARKSPDRRAMLSEALLFARLHL